MSQDTLDLPPCSALADVFNHYASRFPRIHELAASIVLARNHEFSSPAALLSDQDEVALLPPVSGGSLSFQSVIEQDPGHLFALTRVPIDTPALTRRISSPADGAVVAFEGIVRNNTKGRPTRFLEYDCYEPLAIKTMAALGRDLAETHAIGRIAIVHRLGRMEIGEASVVIVAAAPHRRPAFEAALAAIDRLKRTVPIWKKEYFEDGEVWVEGEWDQQLREQTA